MGLFGFGRRKPAHPGEEQIPQGSWFARKHLSVRLDNGSHGGGYHLHLYSAGESTNIAFTRLGTFVYAYIHNDKTAKVRFTLAQLKNDSFLKGLISDRGCALAVQLRANHPWTHQFDEKDRILLFNITNPPFPDPRR